MPATKTKHEKAVAAGLKAAKTRKANAEKRSLAAKKAWVTIRKNRKAAGLA